MDFITLRENPELIAQAAEWFHSKWGVPEEAYLSCMDSYLKKETEYGWYLCLDGRLRPETQRHLAGLSCDRSHWILRTLRLGIPVHGTRRRRARHDKNVHSPVDSVG